MTYLERFPYYFSTGFIRRPGKGRKPILFLSFFAFLIIFSAFIGILQLGQDKSNNTFDDAELKQKLEIYQIIRPHSTGLSPEVERELAEFIFNKSKEYDYDPILILAIIKAESVFYNYSESPKGAVGLMQIKPSVAQEVAGQLNIEWKGQESLYDPFTNVSLGLHYLSRLDKKFGSDISVVLTAYNWGPTFVVGRLRSGESLPSGYSNKVLSIYKTLKNRS